MPQLNISEEVFARMQQHATPLDRFTLRLTLGIPVSGEM